MLQRGTLVVDDAVISDLSRRLNSEVRVSRDMARVEISAVIMDSRRIVEGSLFACVVGEHFDGHDFVQEAVDRGATALLVDRELPMATPQIIVDDVRSALGEVAALVSGRPSDAMKVIGVTGTNGKTTVAQMLAAVFNADGQKSAVIGTLEGDMTTPEAPVLQRRLRELYEDGVSVVAMEVSSHSLVQQRVQGTAFAAAVFTNLGRDHLDLHGTQEEYFRAKSLLFTSHGVKQMIINDDDVHGRLLGDLSSDIGDVYRFSMSDIENLQMALSGSAFVLDGTSFH
ncbi:MAG: Mur ligase family protein, partial [Ilumatobacteraceae bacterium]